MDSQTILIVEDDPIATILMKRIVERLGYRVLEARDGESGLNLFHQERPFLILLDLGLPVLSGTQFIDRMQEMDEQPLIIVQTANDELRMAVETMKKGVYDYCIKPVNSDELQLKIEKAREIFQLKQMKMVLDRESEIRIERQLSMSVFKEHAFSRETDRFDLSLFHNLGTSFSQGAGFGALLSLLSLLDSEAQKDEDGYRIDDEIMDLVRSNAAVARQALEVFREIEFLSRKEFETVVLYGSEIYKMVQHVVRQSADRLKVKNHEIVLSAPHEKVDSLRVSINREYLEKALSEILLNAMKFSPADTKIYILLAADDKRMSLSVMNTPIPGENPGIPAEYERMIFEPFFRLSQSVDERYESLDFGLGLTSVHKTAKRLHGSVTISNIRDYFSKDQVQIAVNLVLSLPIVEVPP